MILYQDCSSHLDSSKTMAARGWDLFSLYIYIGKLKKSPCQKPLDHFNIILQKCSFGDPLPRLFKPFGFVKNMAPGVGRWWWGGEGGRGGGGVRDLFSLYIYIENFKKSSCQKPLEGFQYNFAEMFPWWSFTKIVQTMICQKKKKKKKKKMAVRG